MKLLHWDVIPAKAIEQCSMWMELLETKQYDLELEYQQFEDRFRVPDKKKRKKKKAVKQVVKKAKLLPDKRRQNVGIALKRLKMSFPKIRRAILALDEASLSPELILVLAKLQLEQDEMALCKDVAEKTGAEALGDIEQFFYLMADIPRLAIRLDLLQFKVDFLPSLDSLVERLSTVRRAVDQILHSKPLKYCLKMLLALGNFMNSGTRHMTRAFKLSTFKRLEGSKSTDNKSTIVDYMVMFLLEHKPLVISALPDSLSAIQPAQRTEMQFLETELSHMGRSIKILGEQLKHKPSVDEDQFHAKMQPLHNIATEKHKATAASLVTLMQDYQGCLAAFGEPHDTKWEDFFKLFAEFLASIQASEEKIAHQREAEHKLEMRLEAKRQRLQQKMSKKKLVKRKPKDPKQAPSLEILKSTKVKGKAWAPVKGSCQPNSKWTVLKKLMIEQGMLSVLTNGDRARNARAYHRKQRGINQRQRRAENEAALALGRSASDSVDCASAKMNPVQRATHQLRLKKLQRDQQRRVSSVGPEQGVEGGGLKRMFERQRVDHAKELSRVQGKLRHPREQKRWQKTGKTAAMKHMLNKVSKTAEERPCSQCSCSKLVLNMFNKKDPLCTNCFHNH